MKHYKYNINIHRSTVSAEICYESKVKGVSKEITTDIHACSKDFKKSFWSRATAPTEQQLKDANEWAKEQVELLNKHQQK